MKINIFQQQQVMQFWDDLAVDFLHSSFVIGKEIL